MRISFVSIVDLTEIYTFCAVEPLKSWSRIPDFRISSPRPGPEFSDFESQISGTGTARSRGPSPGCRPLARNSRAALWPRKATGVL